MVNCACEGPRKNKANCPKRGTEAVSRLRIGDRPAAGCPCHYSGGRDTPPLQYATIPAFQSDADCAKRTQLPEAGHRGGVAIADCGLWIADSGQPCGGTPSAACRPGPTRGGCTNKPNWPERIMQNEPNLRQSGWRPRANGAKQSQFGPAAKRPAPRRAKCARRTQFTRRDGAWRGRVHRAKRAQFRRKSQV
jgi:hypothetical protein